MPPGLPVFGPHIELTLHSLRGDVAADGTSATLNLGIRDRDTPISIAGSYAGIADAYSELRRTALLMTQRQRLQFDRGQSALEALCTSALRPARFDLLAVAGGDRIMVFQFSDHPPVALRMGAGQFAAHLMDVAARVHADMN